MTLLRFAWRELWASKGRTALIALILALQSVALGSSLLTYDTLFFTRDHYTSELRLADLEVQIVPAPVGELPSLDALRAIPGVADVSRRFTELAYVQKADGTPLPVVVHHLDSDARGARPAVDDLEMRAGSFLAPGHPEAAIVDRSYAEAYDLHLGDTLVVNPDRLGATYTITGIALSPEYLVPTANPDVLIPGKGTMGIVFVSREGLDRTFAEELYDDLLFSYAPGADDAATTTAVLGALAANKLTVERVVPRASNFGYRYMQEMLGAGHYFGAAAALILAAMAAIVTVISINRLVVSRRREIGALLALGYSPGQFVAGLAFLGLVPGVAGAVLAVPGTVALTTHLARANSAIAGLPDPIMHYPSAHVAIAMASAVIVGFFAALVPAMSILKLRPAHALRGGDEIRFAGMPRVFERLLVGSPSARYALRNAFRRARLSCATAALVGLAIGLPGGLITASSSWASWASSRTDRLAWDAVTSFKVPVRDDVADKILNVDGVADYEGYAQGHATLLAHGQAPAEVRVRGLAVPSALRSLDLAAGSYFTSADADEAILNTAFTHGDCPRVGDTVTLDVGGARHALRVVGLMNDLAFSIVFAPLGTTQRILGLEGEVSGAYLTFGAASPRLARARQAAATAATAAATAAAAAPPEEAETIDQEDPAVTLASRAPAVRARGTGPDDMKLTLLANELVTSVQLRAEQAEAMPRYFRSFDALVGLFTSISILLAFFSLLSVLGFVLLEREGEYATLRTMGSGPLEIAKTVLTEVAALTAVGLAISVGAWVLIASMLESFLGHAWFYIPLDFRARDLALVALPTVGFLVLAALPGIARLMRLDLATVLRGRALG